MADDRPEAGLREVTLLGVPVALFAEGQRRHEEVMREFALVAMSTTESLPRRLVELVSQLRESYARFTDPETRRAHQAVERGDAHIDLRFSVPPSAGLAAAEFAALLDEADEFCRSGDLLALAAPPRLVRFRRWYLGEFTRQIAGEAPEPWREEPADA